MANSVLAVVTKANQNARKLYRTPFNDASIAKVVGKIYMISDIQQAPASLTTRYVSKHAGKFNTLLVTTATAPTTTDSMVFDFQKNGVSLLSATPQLTSASALGVYDASSLIIPGSTINVGDILTVIRTYTAGGGTITMTELDAEWGSI